MTGFKTALASIATAAMLSVPATVTHADLSPSDIQAINGQSGIRVFSADGDFVGLTNGLRVSGERTRLFLLPRSGSIFRLRGRDVIITTKTDFLTLRGNDLVLDASTQRLRIKVQTPASDEDGALTILLLT
ncbi:hypothetical protein [uncultured Tateyamaria sp.]|uniref:hypothetical protein n=1 Tax=uncultured Tateyamaria sp. TaxID=455651 RepID=UPI00262496DD|nr:hypothetical protein [uncultured Tateyamaria sp.]